MISVRPEARLVHALITNHFGPHNAGANNPKEGSRSMATPISNAAQQPQPKPASRMALTNIRKGPRQQPMRTLLYGVEKIGKSSFAAEWPAPIFICAEDGAALLDVQSFPEPRTWDEVLEAIEILRTGDHDRQTLVIDTADWLEGIVFDAICKRDGMKNIEEYGYSKGQNTVALDEWRLLISRLERLRRERSMHVVILAHSWTKPYKNPEGPDYDRFELKMHAKASGLLKEWCDCVLFAAYEQHTQTDRNKRVRGFATGARLLYTQRTAAYDAGNRYGLPPVLPLDYSAFAEAVAAGTPLDSASLVKRIAELAAGADDATRAKVDGYVSSANGNADRLSKILNALAAKLSAKESGQ